MSAYDPANRAYDPVAVEAHWQRRWEEDGTNSFTLEELRTAPRPFFNLMMFPYPSAEGLHVGNIYAFTGADVHGRFKRMQGYDVFEPIGFDAFGIHSENFALKTGVHPMELIPPQRGQLPSPAAPDRGDVRLDPHRGHHRRPLLRVDAVDLRAVLQARAGRAEEGAGQLVPVLHDGAGQRAGDRRRVRAVRHAGGAAADPPVVLQDHRVRRKAPEEPGPHRLVGRHSEGAGATGSGDPRARSCAFRWLEPGPGRPTPGRPTPATNGWIPSASPKRPFPSSPRAPTPSSARPTSCWPRSTRWWTGSPPTPAAGPWTSTGRAPRRWTWWPARRPTRRRRGSSPEASASTRRRDGRCRCGLPTTCSWGTGPGRSWRCRATISATSTSPPPSACRSSRWCCRPGREAAGKASPSRRTRPTPASWSTRALRRHVRRRREARGGGRPGRPRAGRAEGQLPPPRLVRVAAAILGAADPHRPLRGVRAGSGARGGAARRASSCRGLQARRLRRQPPGADPGVVRGPLPRLRPRRRPRNRRFRRLRGQRLVLSPLPVHRFRRSSLRPRDHPTLAPGGRLHRGQRTRGPAPAVFALRRHGAPRHGTAGVRGAPTTDFARTA